MVAGSRSAHRLGMLNGTAGGSQGGRVREIDARQGSRVMEIQRRRLLLALTELVALDGLDGASVERVCRRAGVSRRTFYEVFEDREACLLAGVQAAIERLQREVTPVFDGRGSWVDRVREALTVVLVRLDAEPGTARILIIETMRAGPRALELRVQVIDRLTRAIEQGRGTKSGPPLPPLTSQGVIGAVLHLAQTRMTEAGSASLLPLLPDLMATIVYPYLGAAAAAKEFDRRPEPVDGVATDSIAEPFRDLSIRVTYRTALVLDSIAQHPGASNRQVADSSSITDQGQVSRLLDRLRRAGLVTKGDAPRPRGGKGEPNAWALTDRGHAVHAALKEQ